MTLESSSRGPDWMCFCTVIDAVSDFWGWWNAARIGALCAVVTTVAAIFAGKAAVGTLKQSKEATQRATRPMMAGYLRISGKMTAALVVTNVGTVDRTKRQSLVSSATSGARHQSRRRQIEFDQARSTPVLQASLRLDSGIHGQRGISDQRTGSRGRTSEKRRRHSPRSVDLLRIPRR